MNTQYELDWNAVEWCQWILCCAFKRGTLCHWMIHWYSLHKALRVDRESCQTTSGYHRHPPDWCAPSSAPGPRRPSFSGGRLPRVLLLSGERQPRPGCLHQSPGPHREAPAAWWPPPAHRCPGRELLFRWAWGKNPCGPPKWGSGLWEFEEDRLYSDQAGDLHSASGHEGGGGWCDWGVFCKSKKGLKS